MRHRDLRRACLEWSRPGHVGTPMDPPQRPPRRDPWDLRRVRLERARSTWSLADLLAPLLAQLGCFQ